MRILERIERGAAVALSLGLGLVAGLWLTACTASRSGGAPPPAEPKTGSGPGPATGPDAGAPSPPDAAAPRAAPGPKARDASAPPPAMARRRAVERRQPLPRNYVE